MRALEILLVAACFGLLLRWAALGRIEAQGVSQLPLLLIALLLAGQLLLEGWRWPMLPAYVVAAAMLATALFLHAPGGRLAGIGVGAGLFSLVAAVAVCFVLPMRGGPEATGSFAVGMVVLKLDAPRAESVRGNGRTTALPLVKLWYPVAPAVAGRPHIRGRRAPPLATDDAGTTASGPPLTPAARPLPLLLYFSGGSGARLDNLSLLRELVSHGFAIATVEYPEPSCDGGQKSRGQPPAHPERIMDFSSEAAFRETLRRLDERVAARASDAVMVLDTIAGLASREPAGGFAPQLDAEHAGIFGFSLGGAVAVQACWLDHRFKAVVNMDGSQFAEAAVQGVRQPYLLMSDDTPAPTPKDLAARDSVRRYTAILTKTDDDRWLMNVQRHGGIRVTIAGTRHLNFTDAALRPLLFGAAGTGPIDARRALEIVNAYVLAFFEKYLVGADSPLLSGRSAQFPEVRIGVWPPPAATAAPTAAPGLVSLR